MWIESLEAFAIAHEAPGGTTVTFWNRDFTASPYRPLLIAGPWQEGPGWCGCPTGTRRFRPSIRAIGSRWT
jgi:hypothetical protein